MQDFNNLAYTTSDQHMETSGAQMKRDMSYLAKISSKLTAFTPFSAGHSTSDALTYVPQCLSDSLNNR